jgi:hypothetical protein
MRKLKGNVPKSSPGPLMADSFFWGFVLHKAKKYISGNTLKNAY